MGDEQVANTIAENFHGAQLSKVEVLQLPGAMNAFILIFEGQDESVGWLFIQPYLETQSGVNLQVTARMRVQVIPLKK